MLPITMYDLCCIGHITLDKIVTPQSTVYMPGGTALYFSRALQQFDIAYKLVTAVAETEMHFVDELRKNNTDVTALSTKYTVCFENIYPENQDIRIQKVTSKSDAFTEEQVKNISSKIFHLGPLLADDMGIDVIRELAQRSVVSLDVQGFLRAVIGEDVKAVDWKEKREALQYIHILKASESEAKILTGTADIYESARIVTEWGVNEVIITMGSMGSFIYADKKEYVIPAFKPGKLVDATGCGDTYMAGYLYQRSKGIGIEEAGRFGAAMATLKLAASGPFTGNEDDVLSVLQTNH